MEFVVFVVGVLITSMPPPERKGNVVLRLADARNLVASMKVYTSRYRTSCPAVILKVGCIFGYLLNLPLVQNKLSCGHLEGILICLIESPSKKVGKSQQYRGGQGSHQKPQ